MFPFASSITGVIVRSAALAAVAAVLWAPGGDKCVGAFGQGGGMIILLHVLYFDVLALS